MQQVKRAGLRGEDEGVRCAIFPGDAADAERAEAVRIAGGEDAVARHHDDRKRALDLGERVGHAVDERVLAAVRDELDDDLGVGGGLEDGAVALQPLFCRAEVDKVAIMRNGDEALGGLD